MKRTLKLTGAVVLVMVFAVPVIGEAQIRQRERIRDGSCGCPWRATVPPAQVQPQTPEAGDAAGNVVQQEQAPVRLRARYRWGHSR